MDPLKRLSQSEAAQKAHSFTEEFKAFAFKGNVIDLAVGVIIGTAFGNIIQSLVKNIIMPLVALVIPSNLNYTDWRFEVDGKVVPFGLFLGDVVNFLILALVLFVITVKLIGLLKRAPKEDLPALTKDQQLLTEIRDLLKGQGPLTAPGGPTA
jgi:large conductance mechanosensitive channel